jgi:hypothetical protein
MNTQRLTQDEFIKRCKELYEYDFSHTQYNGTRQNVKVVCNVHGEFEKNARSLLLGAGCKKCNTSFKKYVQSRRMSTADFLIKAADVHDNFYSYAKSEYVNSRTKIIITCPCCGDFEQGAGGHLEGYGCPKCGDKKHGDYRPWFIKTYFDRFPEKKNIAATLYLLYSAEEDFYKVGITTKQDVNDRLKYMSHYEFKIIDYVKDTMYTVAVAEQKILETCIKYKPNFKFGGYSECLKNFVDIHQYIHPSRAGCPESGAMADNDPCSN